MLYEHLVQILTFFLRRIIEHFLSVEYQYRMSCYHESYATRTRWTKSANATKKHAKHARHAD